MHVYGHRLEHAIYRLVLLVTFSASRLMPSLFLPRFKYKKEDAKMRRMSLIARVVVVALVVATSFAYVALAVKPDKLPKPPKDPEPTETLPWGVDRIDADIVWSQYGITGAGIKVAILDTGIDPDHPDVAGNIAECVNTLGDEPADGFEDLNGHGTMIAGTIAAIANGEGVVGVVPDIRLYVARFRRDLLIAPVDGKVPDLCEAMAWCIQKQVDVINMSFSTWFPVYDENGDIVYEDGKPVKDRPLHDPDFHGLVKEAEAAGIIMVAAATNDGERIIDWHEGDEVTLEHRFPASYQQVIAVSMTARRSGGKPSTRDYLAYGSNYGPVIELAAPGSSIDTTTLYGKYTNTFGGTSAAAPHVVGAAALVLAAGAAPGDVRSILQQTAEDLGDPGRDESFGYGMVDAQKAVEYVPNLAPRYTISPAEKLSITWGKIKATH